MYRELTKGPTRFPPPPLPLPLPQLTLLAELLGEQVSECLSRIYALQDESIINTVMDTWAVALPLLAPTPLEPPTLQPQAGRRTVQHQQQQQTLARLLQLLDARLLHPILTLAHTFYSFTGVSPLCQCGGEDEDGAAGAGVLGTMLPLCLAACLVVRSAGEGGEQSGVPGAVQMMCDLSQGAVERRLAAAAAGFAQQAVWDVEDPDPDPGQGAGEIELRWNYLLSSAAMFTNNIKFCLK